MLRIGKFGAFLLVTLALHVTVWAQANTNNALAPAPEYSKLASQGGANAQTKVYKYFAIDLLEGWTEYFPQKQKKNGEYIVVFNNATGDTALTITVFKNAQALSDKEIQDAAFKVMKRLEKNDVIFNTANFDTQQHVFAGAAAHKVSGQQWRLILTQQNKVLYTVLFNGTDLDGASRVLNTLQALNN